MIHTTNDPFYIKLSASSGFLEDRSTTNIIIQAYLQEGLTYFRYT